MDRDAVHVVTGASRGIGAEFCRQLLQRTAGTVVACCRTQTTLEDHPRLRVVDGIDVTDELSLSKLSSQLDRVDLLINNVGILHDDKRSPERSLSQIDADWMDYSYRVNAMGAVLTTKALAKQLSVNDRETVVANLSARVGSLTDNRLGGWYSYRMSKAALNMATRTMAIELKRRSVLCVSLHPGTTDTGLSMPFQKNVKPEMLFKPSFSANQLLDIIDGMTPELSGEFFAWDGSKIDF